jgi:hypothetical protein
MVFTDAGRNRTRDLIISDLNYGMVGTDATAEAVGQTALLSAITATSHAVTTAAADKTITVDYVLTANDANGSTLREFGIFGDAGTMFSRAVFSSMTKASTEQWQISTVYKLV